MLQKLLIKFAPKALAVFLAKTTFPTGYLLGAWAISFAVAFHLLGIWRHISVQRNSQPR
jgi:hypothetical protein